MVKYKKRPVVVEAIRYFSSDGFNNIQDFVGDALIIDDNGLPRIATLEGDMRVNNGDFVIKGIKGEFYPCRPDIFLATYEPSEE